MTMYLIFVKAPINLNKTYYQNERRGEKAIRVFGKDELISKVNELRANGEYIVSVRTEFGGWVLPF